MKLEDGSVLNVVIEVKGEERSSDLVKRRYAEEYWIPGVNSHPELLEHGRWEYLYVTSPSALNAMIDDVKRGCFLMVTNTNQSEAQAYEHVGRKRLTLPTHESAINLDEATIADRRASIDVEESSYPRLALEAR